MIFQNYRQREKVSGTDGGFTLVELLVVVAIIVVLIAILLPALESAIDRGHRAACANNQRQLYMALVSYSSDNNGWSPSTGWYASGMAGNFNNGGGSVPPKGTSLYNWLRYYCQILVVTDQSNYSSVRRLDHRPADGCLLFCPSANLREDCGPWIWSAWWDESGNWQGMPPSIVGNVPTYKYMRYSYLFMGLGLGGIESSPSTVQTFQEYGSTKLNVMDGEGYPIAIFHERHWADGTDQYNSHRSQGINITDQSGSVQWLKASEIPAFGFYGGWAYNKYWIPTFWGPVSSPSGYSGPPGSSRNMNRQYGYKKGGA